MDLSSTFTDDQLAVMGCFAALAVCGLIAMITFYVGPQGRRQQTEQPEKVRLPVAQDDVHRDSRKAA
ncbi:MAG: hypothetical protein NXI04_07230 [Planctomycetaceae bacterium]|nr:hypothetical protein [Planctomycetaceae bacterium]